MDPRAVRVRKALQDALLTLLHSHQFEDITSRQIAALANVAHGTFYRHHDSKETMLEELARREIAALFEKSLGALDEAGSESGALAFCQHFAANKPLWSALLNGGANGFIREEMLRVTLSFGPERSFDGDSFPVDLSIAYANSGMTEIIAWWLKQDRDVPAEYVANLIVELVHNPIRRLTTNPNVKLGKWIA